MAKRRMPPALARYWARKRARAASRRTTPPMARRRFARTRSYVRYQVGRRGRGPRGKANIGGALMDGALVGLANRFTTGYVGPTYGRPLALGAVGWFRNNDTLLTLAGLQLGESLASGIQLPGMGAPTSTLGSLPPVLT